MENHEKILEGIQADITPIVNKSSEVALILTPEAEARAVEFLSQVKRRFKLVDDMRKLLAKPIKEALDNVNHRFNSILQPLEDAEGRVKSALSQWRQSDTFKALEADKAALDQSIGDAIKAGDVAELESLALSQQALNAQVGTVHTQSGSVHYRNVKQWKVTNLDEIPRNFLMPDEKAIKAAIKEGLIIPGIETWVEKQPITRT